MKSPRYPQGLGRRAPRWRPARLLRLAILHTRSLGHEVLHAAAASQEGRHCTLLDCTVRGAGLRLLADHSGSAADAACRPLHVQLWSCVVTAAGGSLHAQSSGRVVGAPGSVLVVSRRAQCPALWVARSCSEGCGRCSTGEAGRDCGAAAYRGERPTEWSACSERG